MINILIVDKMHDSIHDLLSDLDVKSSYKPYITREEILEIIDQYHGLIIRSKTRVDQELIKSASQLKFVARAGAGIDNLDVDELNNRGIAIINAPEGNRAAVAEHVLGLTLNLINNITKSDQEVRNGIWDREGNRGNELVSMTVGLIGYGYMGRAVAKILSKFGCRILVYDRYQTGFSKGLIEEAQMNRLFEEVDILSVHTPLTEETNQMIDDQYFAKFKKEIIFVNTSRGEIVKLSSLVSAIKSGKVRMAGLDVLENEKLQTLSKQQQHDFEYLANSTKTILTPHVAGWSFESYKRINTVLVAKIATEINKNVR